MSTPFRAITPFVPRSIETRYQAFAPNAGSPVDCSPTLGSLELYLSYGGIVPCGDLVGFGETGLGNPVDLEFILYNNGQAPVKINSFSLSGTSYSALSQPAVGWMVPGAQQLFTISFEANELGQYVGSFTIGSSFWSSPCTINLTGSVLGNFLSDSYGNEFIDNSARIIVHA